MSGFKTNLLAQRLLSTLKEVEPRLALSPVASGAVTTCTVLVLMVTCLEMILLWPQPSVSQK